MALQSKKWLLMARWLCLVALAATSLSVWASTQARWQAYQDQATRLYEQQQYEGAIQQLERAIALTKGVKGGESFQASSLNLLAFALWDAGQQQQALRTQAQAVQVARQVAQLPKTLLAQFLFNQGDLLERAQQFDPALEAYQQAWALQQASKEPTDRLATAWALARLYSQAKQHQKVVEVAQQAHAQLVRSTSNAQALQELNFIWADSLVQQQQPNQAQTVLEQYLTTLQQQSPPPNAALTATLERLARLAEQQGQSHQASALRTQLQALNQGQGVTLNSVMNLNELGMVQHQQKHYAAAIQYYQQAEQQLQQLGQQHSVAQATVWQNWGVALEDSGDTKAALQRYQDSADLYTQLPDSPPILVANSAQRLAAMHYLYRQYTDAEYWFVIGLERLDQANADADSLLIVLDNLITTLKVQNKTTEAQPYEKRATQLRERAGITIKR